MQLLITDIISYSKTNSVETGFDHIDLNLLLTETLDELKPEIADKNAIIEISELPAINGITSLVQQLLETLLEIPWSFQSRY